MGGTIGIWEHRGSQFKLERLTIHYTDCAIAVIEPQQKRRHLLTGVVSAKGLVVIIYLNVVRLFSKLCLCGRWSQNLGPHLCSRFHRSEERRVGKEC